MWSVDAQISSFALFLAGQEIQLYTGCPKILLNHVLLGMYWDINIIPPPKIL